MWHVHDQTTNTAQLDIKNFEGLRTALERIHVEEEINLFVSERSTGQTRPGMVLSTLVRYSFSM